MIQDFDNSKFYLGSISLVGSGVYRLPPQSVKSKGSMPLDLTIYTDFNIM